VAGGITVTARKFDGTAHYQWETRLLERNERYIAVRGEYGRVLKHFSKQRTFRMENESIELYLPQEWFCVIADVENGRISSWYCNIALPIEVEGAGITFVDADLDLTGPDLQHMELVDEDEFLANTSKMDYPEWLVTGARAAVVELRRRIDEQAFPFDGTIDRLLRTMLESTPEVNALRPVPSSR